MLKLRTWTLVLILSTVSPIVLAGKNSGDTKSSDRQSQSDGSAANSDVDFGARPTEQEFREYREAVEQREVQEFDPDFPLIDRTDLDFVKVTKVYRLDLGRPKTFQPTKPEGLARIADGVTSPLVYVFPGSSQKLRQPYLGALRRLGIGRPEHLGVMEISVPKEAVKDIPGMFHFAFRRIQKAVDAEFMKQWEFMGVSEIEHSELKKLPLHDFFANFNDTPAKIVTATTHVLGNLRLSDVFAYSSDGITKLRSQMMSSKVVLRLPIVSYRVSEAGRVVHRTVIIIPQFSNPGGVGPDEPEEIVCSDENGFAQ